MMPLHNNTNTNLSVPSFVWNGFNACNVIVRKEMMLDTFLSDLMSKQPFMLTALKNIFKGKGDVKVTIADTSADTPFRCHLLATLCKQLQDELQFSTESTSILLSGVKGMPFYSKDGVIVCSRMTADADRPFPCHIPANMKFETTDSRDAYLSACFRHELDEQVNIKVSRYPLRHRDICVRTASHTLFIRTGDCFTSDWEVRSKGFHPWTSYLHEMPRNSIICSNRQAQAEGKRGFLISFEICENAPKQ